MDIETYKERQFPAVATAVILLILCIVPGQLLITKQFPFLSGLVQINPSLVFLDIPLPSPISIDLILVPGLFLLIYPILVLLYPSRPGLSSWKQAMHRARNVFVGLLTLLICLLLGGLIYYLLQDHLSVRVKNSINTLGINADIHLSYPGFETIHLRGSFILFVCFFIGLAIFIRKIKKEPGMSSKRLTREQRMTPYERMMREKRMMQKSGQQEFHSEKSWQPIIPSRNISLSERIATPRVCYNQPVMTMTPLAVNYMPMV